MPLSPDHLKTLLLSYGLQDSRVEFLRHSQNLVYACDHDGGKTILRISKGRHRTLDQMAEELRWVSYLASQGVHVCAPVLTQSGETCFATEIEGQSCLVAALEHAPGIRIGPQEVSAALYEKLGRLLGQLHAHRSSADRDGQPLKRPQWFESRLLREDVALLGSTLSDRFRASMEHLIQTLRSEAASPESYGLIHADVSFGNCFLHEGELWIFDFDNCEYGSLLQDLATVLYDSIYCRALNKFADAGLNDRMRPCWDAFLAGYAATGVVKEIPEQALKQFFLLREAVIYIHYHRTLNVSQINDSFRAGLEVMRKNVEQQEHQVDFAMFAR